LKIRTLSLDDVPAVMALTNAANWNHEPEDWARVIRLAGPEAWCIEAEGAIVATTTAVTYPAGPAWIGMVLTHPDWRGRGLARSLMNHALEQLDATGTTCQKLDATDMGRPLYRSLGFEEMFAVERWEGVAARFPGSELPPVALDEWVLRLDRLAFGDNRRSLLAALLAHDSAEVPESGIAFSRGGRNARFFGPCVAANEETARSLARELLGRQAGQAFYWDLIPGHRAAADLARDLGFRPVRRLVRMRRGGGVHAEPWPQKKVFALAGFEFG
jgi:GNAT superfamily N-acetyltransferase